MVFSIFVCRLHQSLRVRLPMMAVAAWFGCIGPARAMEPEPDSVFQQETGVQVESGVPPTSVATLSGRVFVGTADGVEELRGDSLEKVGAAMKDPVDRLVVAGSSLWALGPKGLYRLNPAGWRSITNAGVTDVAGHRGDVWVAAGKRLFQVIGNDLKPVDSPDAPFPIHRIVSHQESLWIAGEGRLTTFSRGTFGGLDMYGFPADQAWDWGDLPGKEIRDTLSAGNRLMLATGRGVGVLRGMVLSSLMGAQGLPYEDVVCLASGVGGEVWMGTSRGAIRQVGGAFHYFAGRRWLPDDRVTGIAVDGDSVYLATPRGLGVIRRLPFTLAKKAAYYERYIAASGQKRLGLLHKLEWDDGLKEFVREAGDNDGGYSGDYLAAQSYRYAVTHDPVARREATNTFHALRWLERMTGIPGFPARSVWVKGERGHKSTGGSGGYPAEWHDAADARFEWKGDTSSDELCSHFYAVTRFLELAAEGDERRQAIDHLVRIADHLIGHGWQLIDVDGKPTRWGRWDPNYFLSDEGRFDRGLQALELLSFVKTAENVTGDARFTAAYEKLVSLGYPGYTLRERQTAPPEAVLHFEDQLAFWSYWTLIRYEKDADLRALYRRSFERTYEILRVEHQPWFNFLHRAITGEPGEEAASLAHLREWPLDLRIWSFQNSHRADLRTPAGYSVLKGGIQAISPRESQPIRWDSWTLQLDGGSDGRDVVDPGSWLLAYWMGRFHGIIAAPANAADGEWREQDGPALPKLARIYDGPERPPVP